MDRNTMQYYLEIVRKGYKTMPGILGMVIFMPLIFAGLFAFLLFVYEPANEWHTTTFTLSHCEYRYSRGGGVLDLYTTDGRRYVLNQNQKIIRHQLREGQQYHAVFSDDFFHDIIQGLSDTESEYLNADEMRKSHTTDRLWFSILLVLCIFIHLISNSAYAISCIRDEEKKRRKRINKKK